MKTETVIKALDIISSTNMTEEQFYQENDIDPDEMSFLGSGEYGEAYSVGSNRVLKMTSSNSEFNIAKVIMKGRYHSFVEIYAVAEISDGRFSYYILQEELEHDDDIEDLFAQTTEALDSQELPVQYIHYFDEEEYELSPDLSDFMQELQNVVDDYRKLGIEASDIRPENLGRGADGRLKGFDIDDRDPNGFFR